MYVINNSSLFLEFKNTKEEEMRISAVLISVFSGGLVGAVIVLAPKLIKGMDLLGFTAFVLLTAVIGTIFLIWLEGVLERKNIIRINSHGFFILSVLSAIAGAIITNSIIT